MFGGAGPAIGNHWGIGSLTDPGELIMPVTDEYAMHRLAAARQAAGEREQRQDDMLSFGMAQVKKEGSTGRYDGTFRWKELSFKEKLQEEIDEWLDKVLD